MERPIRMRPFIQRHLPRRTVLRGLGTSLALPWLESMTPALSRAASAAPPRRLVMLCAGLGFHAPHFFPEKAGRDYVPSLYLDLLSELRSDFTVISGLSHRDQSGADGHASHATWLTAARHPGKPGFKNSASIDQVIAERIGTQTRFPYLTLRQSYGTLTLSWSSTGVMIPGHESPAKLFKQLFTNGSPQAVAEQQSHLKRGRSILDFVSDDAHKLNRQLPSQDQAKLDEYLTAVRELEADLASAEAWAVKPRPKVTVKPIEDIKDGRDAIGHVRQMYDLIHLILQTDSTRVITYNLGGLSQVPSNIDGVTQDWHGLSHHGQDPSKIAELQLIEQAEFGAFRDFLSKLKKTSEQAGNLLDQTSVLLGSNLGNASAHSTDNLPILLAGGGFQHGQHLAFDNHHNAPLSNLFVQLAHRMQVEIDQFGQSNAENLNGLASSRS